LNVDLKSTKTDVHNLQISNSDYLCTIKNLENQINEFKQQIKEIEETNINTQQKNSESSQNIISTLTNENDELRTQLEYQKSMNRILSSIVEQKFKLEAKKEEPKRRISNFSIDHGLDQLIDKNTNNQEVDNLSNEVKHLKEMNNYLNNELRSMTKTE